LGSGAGPIAAARSPALGMLIRPSGVSMVVYIRPLPVMTPSKGPPIAPLLILTR